MVQILSLSWEYEGNTVGGMGVKGKMIFWGQFKK